jgi:hypothetical protein
MLTNESKTSKLLLCAAALTALTAVGCATDDVASDEGAENTDTLALAASGGEGNVPNPSGAFFVSVKPMGTGCPAGTTQTSISPDGKTFTTTFSAFEATVNNRQSVAVKDCQLAIKLKSPSGLSYTVTEFYYQGYAYLEEGQTARQISRYYFQGAPVQAEEVRTDLKGPFDDTYTFEDKIRTTDFVWSPCGVERDLNVRATLRLQNSSKKDGYINLGAVDANTDTKVRFKLNWKKCS